MIFGIKICCQAIDGVIGLLDDFLFIIKDKDGCDGRKNLLVSDVHVIGDVGDDGRQETSIMRRMCGTACDDGCTFVCGVFEEFLGFF